MCFVFRDFCMFSFSAFQRGQTKKDSRLSQDSYLYINLISIMKNNSYSVHARLHDCSLSKRAIDISIALIYRDLCFRMERFHQHLEAFSNEKKQSYILQVRWFCLILSVKKVFYSTCISLTKRYIFFSLIDSILYFFDACLFLFDLKDGVRCLGIYRKPVCNAWKVVVFSLYIRTGVWVPAPGWDVR